MKKVIFISCIASIALAGCSTPIVAWKGRPFGDHDLDPKSERSRLYVMTAERRLGILVPRDGWDMRFCAESLPEAAMAQSAKSSFDLSDGSKDAGTDTVKVNDEVLVQLTKTFDRTEKAEVLRQLGWQLCQAWAQGVLDDEAYKKALLALVEQGQGLLVPASAPSPTVPTATTPVPPVKTAGEVAK